MDAGGKRCLPMWMLKKCSSEEVQEAVKGENGPQVQGPAQGGAPEAGEDFSREEARILDDNTGSLLSSEAVKRSRKFSRLDSNCRISNSKSGLRKKDLNGKAVHNRRALQKASNSGKLKQSINESGHTNDVDLEALFLTKSEDDGELTVEDLVSIAEEYVNADKERQHLEKASEESNSVAHRPSEAVSSKNNVGVLGGAAQSKQQISKCTTTYSSHATATGIVESAPHRISRTGDVAQDMLDVFLGPLLRIPTEEMNFGRTRGEDMSMAYGCSEPHRKDLSREEELPFTKKKSSLKDMVGIFLSDAGRTDAP